MNIGVSGKKYGLQLPKRAEERAKRPIAKPLSVFAADEDDDVEADIARQASKKKSAKELEQMHAKALEQDPSIFDYDGVYDEIQGARAKAKEEKQAAKQPKYIAKLLEKAKEREMERDIVFERQLIKERAKEDHLFGDKERFVTSAYKRKLAEQAKWLVEEKQREQREAADEVTKKGDMSDFYRNLLSKNVAFGAKPEAPKKASPVEPPSEKEPSEPSVRGKREEGKEGEKKTAEPDAMQAGQKRKELSLDVQSKLPGGRSVGREGEAGSSGRAVVTEGEGVETVGGLKIPDGRKSEAMGGGGVKRDGGLKIREGIKSDVVEGGGVKGVGGLNIPEGRKSGEVGRSDLGMVEKDVRPKLSSGEGVAGARLEEKAGGGEKDKDAVAAARERYLARKKMRT